MSVKKQQFDQNSAFAKSFKSPLFLAIAACFSVIFVAVLITLLTVEVGIGAILALIFSGVATLCAWLLYATPVTKGKLISLRLYMAYRKIMNTFAIVFVSIFGAIIVVACIVLGLMSDMIKEEIVPMLESDVKPMLEEMVASAELMEEELGDIADAYEAMPQELRDLYGIESPEDYVNMVNSTSEFAEKALEIWDDIIKVLETDFMTVAVIAAILYVVAIVGMWFISSAFKKTAKYIRALAEEKDAGKQAPFIVSFIGGGCAAVGAIVCIIFVPAMGISALVTAATPILFAIFFKQMNDARKEEALAAIAADAVVVEETVEAPAVEAPVVEEAVAEETVEAPAEETAEEAAEAVVAEEAASEE